MKLDEELKAKDDYKGYEASRIPRIDPRNVVEKEVDYKKWSNGDLCKLVYNEEDKKWYNLRRIEYFCIWTQGMSPLFL